MGDHQKIALIVNSLRELNRSYYQATRKDAEACGVTQIQHLVLRILKQYPLIGLNELSDMLHTGASTASGVVDRLVHAGLIVRDRPETDRRAVILKLTEEGEELLARSSERVMKRLSPLLTLSDEDIEHLIRIHGQIITMLQKAKGDN